MNAHPLKQYFEARRDALLALSDAVVHTHTGTAGNAREVLIRELLTVHLPPALAVGTGLVFGHDWARGGNKNDISTQQDVVIYRDDFPLLEVGGDPLFFRESVVATMEVKTNYEKAKLPKIIEDARSVRRVKPAPVFTFQMSADGPILRNNTRRVLCGVFYFRGLETRSGIVAELNALLSKRAFDSGVTLEEIDAPDFFFSPQAGLIVRNPEFNLIRCGVQIKGLDDVHGGLTEEEQKLGAYRRAFGGDEKWRGLQAIILELSERCQRYAASYTTLSDYA
jgi:hypothetical protein